MSLKYNPLTTENSNDPWNLFFWTRSFVPWKNLVEPEEIERFILKTTTDYKILYSKHFSMEAKLE